MAKNKVTVDGTTLIDLSTTGIETAADIPAGKYGYLRTGERVVGTGENMSPLNGKILAVTGDSIAAGAGYTGGYAGIIGTEQGMTIQNIAVGGGTIINSGSNVFCISESIPYLRSDADYILLEGGGNDSDSNVTLGTLTSGYNDTLDTTTFAGAFENMLKSAIARFPNKKIGYILIHKCAYQFDSRVPNSYYDIVINACKKWGIPYLDLNTQVPPLGYIADLKSTYTANADGYHPNELGYRTFYVPQITEFMKSMITDYSLISKTITDNGTYLASSDNADGYSSVTVNVQSTPSATAHTIEFEFTDETSTTLTGYWDAAFISSAITATTPVTYNGQTVESASLDGVAWYTKPSGTWETVWEGTSTPNTDGGEYFWITDMSAVDVANGFTWRITIDGTAYVCTAKQATISYLGLWTVLGNPGHAGGTDDGSGVPFCFYNYNGQAFCGDTNLPVKSYSLKFERQISA